MLLLSRYCSTFGDDVRGGSDDKVFLSRAKMLSAKMLSVNDKLIYGHPDLQQVQIELLLSLYFLVSSQVNR